MTMTPAQLTKEFQRVSSMISAITTSVPIMMMSKERVERIERDLKTDETLCSLARELEKHIRAIKNPEDHVQMAQAYEAYSEASFYLEMKDRDTTLIRTPGTGKHKEKRPDFCHEYGPGKLYFELKALEISDPISRHTEIACKGLDIKADLDGRARKPGVHFGEPQEISGHFPGADAVELIDATIIKISNNIKTDQIQYGPTVLVVDLGRLSGSSQGPSGLLPVFYHDEPPAESCVSGEYWQIALGKPGEQVFRLPDFDGKTNLAGHQTQTGILHQFPSLVAVTFLIPAWSKKSELLTIWNASWDQDTLRNSCKLSEHDIENILCGYSDGVNDRRNESGWFYRTSTIARQSSQDNAGTQP